MMFLDMIKQYGDSPDKFEMPSEQEDPEEEMNRLRELTGGKPQEQGEESEGNAGNIGIGTGTPATSAIVDITTTTGALLLSRMNTAARDALTAVNGMIIYNSQTNAFNFRENGVWISK